MSRPTTIRITLQYFDTNVNLVPTLLRCTDDPDNALIVMEHEPYDHIHAFINANVSEKPIREKIYKLTSQKGNPVLSVSPLKEKPGLQGFLSYLVKKPTTDILFSGKNIDIKALKAHYAKVTGAKSSKDNNISRILSYLEKNGAEFSTPAELGVHILSYYCSQNMPINRAFVGQLITSIYLKTNSQYMYHVSKEIVSTHAPELCLLPSLLCTTTTPRGFNTHLNPTTEHIEQQILLSQELDVEREKKLILDYKKFDLDIE